MPVNDEAQLIEDFGWSLVLSDFVGIGNRNRCKIGLGTPKF
jgi:hypothetical protein